MADDTQTSQRPPYPLAMLAENLRALERRIEAQRATLAGLERSREHLLAEIRVQEATAPEGVDPRDYLIRLQAQLIERLRARLGEIDCDNCVHDHTLLQCFEVGCADCGCVDVTQCRCCGGRLVTPRSRNDITYCDRCYALGAEGRVFVQRRAQPAGDEHLGARESA